MFDFLLGYMFGSDESRTSQTSQEVHDGSLMLIGVVIGAMVLIGFTVLIPDLIDSFLHGTPNVLGIVF